MKTLFSKIQPFFPGSVVLSLVWALLPLGSFAQTGNYFAGTNAGAANTTGDYNSFVGYHAGYSNTTGNYNSFLGYRAGYSNTTGNYNSFLGNNAGYYNTTGYYNSFLGNNAGYYNTTGHHNSFLGNYAGYYNTTGYYNSFVGFQAGLSNTTGYNNSFVGFQAGYHNTTGSSNSFLGFYAGFYNTTGTGNLFLGSYANTNDGTLTNVGAIGYQSYVSASNSLVLGSINGVNGATTSTKVGIGITAPAYLLHVNGEAAKPGSSAWTVASDERLKKDVSAFTDGLEVLTQIKPVKFRYNGKAAMPTQQEFVGVIAQQVQKIAPYMIGKFTYQDTTGKQEDYLDYDATALTYILVNAVKEQQQQLVEKDARIESLESRLNKLEQLLMKQPTVPTAEGGDGAARLWQNEPNPTDGSTVIRYRIPLSATSAQLKLFSTSGQELQSFELSERGEGSRTIAAGRLASGTYIYYLVVDSKRIDAKKLVLAR